MAKKSPRKEFYDLLGKYGLSQSIYWLSINELDMSDYLREIRKEHELADLHYESYRILSDAYLKLTKLWSRG